MNGAGLFSGDLVIVDRSRDAKHGDIVIAALNGVEARCYANHITVPLTGLRMSNLAELLFHSSLLLGMCILLACSVANTSILYFCRGTRGPGYWASCCWLLLVSYCGFLVDLLDDKLTFGWSTSTTLIAAQSIMMLGVFRFLGRPVPSALLPLSLSVGTQ